MADAKPLLQAALAAIARLEALAGDEPIDRDALRRWAREHFAELLTVERALASGTAPGAPAIDSELWRSLDAVSAAELESSIPVALGALMQLTGAQRGFIALREPDGSLSFPAARAFASLGVASPEAQVSRTILELALGGQPLRVSDASADARFLAHESVQALGLRAVLVVPLAARGRPFGVLYLDNPSRASAFGEDAEAAAGDFARLVAPILARDVELIGLRKSRDRRLAELRERFKLDGLIGASAPMVSLLELIGRVAPRDATVLICGETGTGKELVAQALHLNSARASEPFVALNCGALPGELIESELFGHERGAFTGATAARTGRFELADGGTLLLDEVGEMPPAAQVRLLRVLESGSFERVGSSHTQSSNVRVIAATNRDLDAEVAKGRFRSDLLFRLKVIELRVPALRDRDGDVTLLARAFVERHASRHGTPLRLGIEPAALAALEAYGWPGNVRELRNVLERAVILADGDAITVDLLPPEVAGSAPASDAHSLKRAVRAFKRRFVARALADAAGDHAAAAKRLGVHPKYLYQLMRGLDE